MRVDLLPDLAALVEGGEWTTCPGTSRADTWRVEHHDGRPAVVVKAGNDAVTNADIEAEAARWEWLDKVSPIGDGDVPRPEVLGHQPATEGRPAAIVTSEVEGVAELHWFLDAPIVAELLGKTLRAVHDLPVDSCPFEAGPKVLVEAAEARVAAGRIDPVAFHAAHQRYSPAELLGHVKALLAPEPQGDDRVVVHGDWSIGNLIGRPDTGAVAGIVDWGGLGVGDRHYDLGAAARSLLGHFGGEIVPAFLDAYGFADPDPLRLDFYVLVDQFR